MQLSFAVRTKEAYTWWHKIGGLEKTVAAFSLAAWCLYSANLPSLNTLKSCKTKTNPKFGDTLFSRTSEFSTHQNNLILAFHQFEAYWLSKTMAVIPRLFKEDFALTFFESEAKHRFCFRGCRSVLDQTARIWFLYLLSSGGLEDDVISISLLAAYGNIHLCWVGIFCTKWLKNNNKEADPPN